MIVPLVGQKAGITLSLVSPVHILNAFENIIPILRPVIYAVSTNAVNPLQALQDLHNRNVELPPWIDPTILRYSLIVHPANSPLADPMYV